MGEEVAGGMGESTEQEKSLVVPVLVAALICDVAVADPSTGKKNLIGIFDRVIVGAFPTKRAMSLYFKLADAEGFYDIEVKYINRSSNSEIVGAKTTLKVKDRLLSTDLYIPFPPLPIPKKGRYEFQIWANSVFLGIAFLDAVSRTVKKA